MREDYLWDRTGSDPEIERLESQLRTFRYEPAAAPAVVEKTATLVQKPRRSFFSLGFAFAAVLLAAGSVAWLQVSRRTVSTEPASQILAAGVPAAPSGVVELPMIAGQAPEKQKDSFIDKRENSAVRIYKHSKRPQVLALRSKRKERLTVEEKYAYSQLMLALSVTSSELKKVSDAVSGSEITDKPIDEKRSHLKEK